MDPARHNRARAPLRGALFTATSLTLFLFTGSSAQAVIPLPTYPNCGADGTAKDCPPDVTRADGSLAGDSWALVNFIPAEQQKQIRKQELAMGAGSATTLAWQKTTGRSDVKVAVLDCGIKWKEDSLRNKVALNTGELSLPIGADGKTCAKYDCDGNGIVNVEDYAYDPRVLITAGRDDADGKLDPSDVLYTFADGLDNDGDGYIDNVAGWDFMWDDNDPYTSNDFYHMSSVLTEAAGEGGEQDSDIGHCPNCSILPVRISDSFVGEGDKIAEGIVYAVDHGANVIGMALGSMTNPTALQSAMLYAWDHDVTIVAAAGDELGYHHNFPGANDHAIYVHSIKYYPTISLETSRTLLGYFGCNNFGARLDAVAASGACATGSVAATTGMAGLVYSRARDLGIALSASEVRQLLLRNTDDIDVAESRIPGSPYFPSHKGWDYFFGHGRINSGRSINAIGSQTIPPEIELTSPAWFTYFDPRVSPTLTVTGEVAARRASSYSYTVEWAAGVDPGEQDYTEIQKRTNLTTPTIGTLATLDLTTIDPAVLDAAAPIQNVEGSDTMLERADKINAHGITLRIRVTDSFGNVAEERKQVFLEQDADLLPGFPMRLGYSGESSPVLYDLDGNGVKDIILATSNGIIHAIKASGVELPGWPVKVAVEPQLNSSNAKNHLKGTGYASGQVSADIRQGIIGTAAVGDLDNDGVAEVVVPTLEGYVYAFTADGKIKTGFPVQRDAASDAQTNNHVWLDPGMFSSTVLYDLEGDGKLEIIQASMDQKVYAWKSTGQKQPGFPVAAYNPDGTTNTATVGGRIVSSPAVGDLDGDGRPEIVFGTNEYAADKSYVGYIYAIHGDGNNDPEGAVLAGWPVPIMGALSGVINYIGEGVTASPSIADVNRDGQQEVMISGVGGCPELISYDGSKHLQLGCRNGDMGKGTNSNDHVFWTVVSNGSFSDMDGDGAPEAIMNGSGMSFFIALGVSRYEKWDHLLTMWNTRTGKMMDNFPRVTEDISFFNAPVVGDVSGDGKPEIVSGTSGYILHAFKADGTEALGWPKFTGGWMIASPAVGDISGDGKNEVVQITREGYLFVWKTAGTGASDWPTFRHDPQNTGNYQSVPETAALLPIHARPEVAGAESSDEAAGCSISSHSSSRGLAGELMVGLGLAGMLIRRRSRRG